MRFGQCQSRCKFAGLQVAANPRLRVAKPLSQDRSAAESQGDACHSQRHDGGPARQNRNGEA